MNRKDVSHNCAPLLVNGKPIESSSFTATDAKNEFGQMLEMVTAGRAVVITKHDTPKAVMISYDEFMALAERGKHQLNSLRAEFDELLSSMQTPEARAGIKAAFDASPTQLGRAAVSAMRRRIEIDPES